LGANFLEELLEDFKTGGHLKKFLKTGGRVEDQRAFGETFDDRRTIARPEN
jgi:hypothetical protein